MHTGTLNGYVAVPEGHHLYLKDYDKLDVSVHGGLTYSAEGDGFWWFGFDTSHCYDLVPAWPSQSPRLQANEVYRDLDYVCSQTTQLAQQLAAHSEIINADAAPELYAALKAFLKIEFMNLEEDDELKAAYEKGRDAIRKALN